MVRHAMVLLILSRISLLLIVALGRRKKKVLILKRIMTRTRGNLLKAPMFIVLVLES